MQTPVVERPLKVTREIGPLLFAKKEAKLRSAFRPGKFNWIEKVYLFMVFQAMSNKQCVVKNVMVC